MHPSHDRVAVGIDREHRVAFEYLAGLFVHPGVPQPRQPPEPAPSRPKAPRDVLAALLTGFKERLRRDDAALALRPWLFEAGFGAQFFGPCVACREGQHRRFGEPRDRPRPYKELAPGLGFVPRGTDERRKVSRNHVVGLAWWVDCADAPVAPDVGDFKIDVPGTHDATA